MPRLDRLPYQTPPPELVRTGGWRLVVDDKLVPLGGYIPDWDPAVSVRALISIEADVVDILDACGLPHDSRLRLGAIWRSPGSGLRGLGESVELVAPEGDAEAFELSLEAPGMDLSHSLTLSACLVMLKRGDGGARRFSPVRPGSVLWRHEESVLLEGEGTRFPVEALDFAASTWLPSEAAWFLDWDPHAFDQAVLGGIRLYVNAGSERVRMAVAGGPEAEPAIRESIRYDVARTLISGSFRNANFLANADSYEEGTVGAAVRRLIRALFPYESLEALQSEHDEQPHRFFCRLQDSLAMFSKT